MSFVVQHEPGRQGPSRGQCPGAQAVAEGTAVCFSPLSPHPGPIRQVRSGRTEVNPRGPIRDEQHLVPEDGSLVAEREVQHSAMAGRVDAGGGPDQARALDQEHPLSGLATREATLREEGFDEQSIGVMLDNRAKSTNQRYEWYWGKFIEFCSGRKISNPREAKIQDIVGFVDFMTRSNNYAFSTTKICASAVSFFLKKADGVTAFSHPRMKDYLEGAERRCKPKLQRPDPWDVSKVLQAFRKAPFEPMETADMKWVSAKLATLFLLLTAGRGCEITALSVKGLVISQDDVKAVVYPEAQFMAKTASTFSRRAPTVFDGFYPNPSTEEERDLHLICPVRCLRMYLDRTKAYRRTNKLFVCYGRATLGKGVSKQRLTHWVTDGISKAYTLAGETPPKLRAHSTRGAATSVALLSGVDWGVIQQTACWSGERTFWNHYFQDRPVRSVARAVLEQAI